MDYIVKNNEPLALVNSMNSYFKQRPPDCSLFSQYNCEIKIHRELLYQTSYLRDMIKSVNMDYSCCKIEIVCPHLSKFELETISSSASHFWHSLSRILEGSYKLYFIPKFDCSKKGIGITVEIKVFLHR